MNKADLKLFEDVRKLYEEKHFFHWDLEFPEVFIDLETANWSENPGFDAVIGNPPYGDILDKKSKEYLFLTTGLKTGGRAEVYANFLILSTQITKQNGYQSFIIPNTCLDGLQFSNFRKIITNSTVLRRIFDFRNQKIFSEAEVMTMIVILQNQINSQSENYIADYYINNQFDQEPLKEKINISIDSEFPWRPFNSILSKIENSGLCVDLSSEIGTCHDAGVDYKYKNVGWQNRGQQTSLSDLLFYHGEQKQQQDYRLLKGENLNRYSLNYEDNYLVFDFEKYKSSQTVVAVYLDLNLVPVKILTRQTSDSIQASIDCEQFITSKSIHTTIIKAKNYSAFYVICILNSKLLTYIYQCKTGEKGRTFAQVKLYDLRQLPIRKINFTTESDRRQQGLENLINLYQTYQNNFDPSPILSQCEQHLKQEPEEADIIHDFLAHLAEQMIQLNQQKQTEIKGFLKWLERFIGCSVDTLKNKSKIQNYLGDYNKQQTLDPALNFDNLIKILNQNKKLIKIDPNSRKDQEPIENEYQTSLNTLLPIKTQLKNCDRLIDEIVYQLYGLTPEEKAIIENSLNK
jgi:hypothetical protein